jgi:hypothetical protein
MPLYTFEHPVTEETVDLIFGMNDEKLYTDENGTKWNRVYHIPETSIDAQMDPFSKSQFMEKTGKNKGTVGELMDRSKDLSEQRKSKLGYDPLQKKYFKEYSEKRNGTKHHLDR